MRILALALAAMVATPAFAYDTPRELVDAIYAPYLSGQQHDDLLPFYSAHLRELFAQHAQRQIVDAAVHVPAVPTGFDFNPFIDADNALLFDLKVGEPQVLGDDALITVSFHNFDHPSLLSLALVREADGWKVDDVASTGASSNWMLSWLLLYDPWDVK